MTEERYSPFNHPHRALIICPESQDYVVGAVRDAVDLLWGHTKELSSLEFDLCITGLKLMLQPYDDANAAAARSEIEWLIAQHEGEDAE